MERSCVDIDLVKFKKALEQCGIYMTKITDKRFGFLYVEMTPRKISVGRRWFLCVSSETNKDIASKQPNFKAILQKSWDKHVRPSETEGCAVAEQPTPTEQEQPPAQPTPSQAQPAAATTTTATPTTRAVSPSTGSPQLRGSEDSDLLDFFRGIVNPQHLAKDDLFVSGVTGIGLRTKLAFLGWQLRTIQTECDFTATLFQKTMLLRT